MLRVNLGIPLQGRDLQLAERTSVRSNSAEKTKAKKPDA